MPQGTARNGAIVCKFNKSLQHPAGRYPHTGPVHDQGGAKFKAARNKRGTMIFRAVFWIGLVSLLMPHEPNLGLGRPGAGTVRTSPPAVTSVPDGLSGVAGDCGFACAGGLGLLQRFGFAPGGAVAARLADVKAQIDADIAARAARGL